MAQPVPNQSVSKINTAEISTKETSQTLVEFPNKNANFPEWRLKLQNAIRERKEKTEPAPNPNVQTRRRTVTSNANSFSVDVIENKKIEQTANPLLELALQRISKSRKLYEESTAHKSEQPAPPQMVIKPVQAKTYQFAIPNKAAAELIPPSTQSTAAEISLQPESLNEPDKAGQNEFVEITKVTPRIVKFEENEFLNAANTPASMSTKIERIKTNKLPSLIPASISSSFGKLFGKAEATAETPHKVEIKSLELDAGSTTQIEEIEDAAPFSMRFNSAVFDLIIGGFLSLILISPFMLMGGQWFTFEGFFGFLATCSIVMFIYLTTTIGLLGKTFGMRLFSLEMIDANDSEYPTFHQAAVSSSVYLLSLAFGGIGFLTVFMNNERRAFHDLLSRTIVVREM
jgi:uncharacterized RDD family membrane protein YckC